MTFSSSITWLAYSSAAVTSLVGQFGVRVNDPGHGVATGHHAENVLHHNAGASNCGLPAADFGIDNDTIIHDEFLTD
jgi:hypothetical protein